MSTLSRAAQNLFSLLYPAYCIGCGKVMSGRQEWICVECWEAVPLTLFHQMKSNPMAEKLQSLCPSIESAAAQFFYINKGVWRHVIHEIKYHRSWLSARKLGYIYGCELLESPLFQHIDVVVPVPLHRSRRLHRRYNQSEMIAEGVARAMNIEVNNRCLQRTGNNPSQVTKGRHERWSNVSNIFTVKQAEALEGKHILVVDDVLTTGATIISCCEALLAQVENCRISVATLAVSRAEIIGSQL